MMYFFIYIFFFKFAVNNESQLVCQIFVQMFGSLQFNLPPRKLTEIINLKSLIQKHQKKLTDGVRRRE